MNIGTSEILLILIVVFLLFGGKKLPELARSIGKGLSEFRRAAQEVQREITKPIESVDHPQPTRDKPDQASQHEDESTPQDSQHVTQPRIPEEKSPPSS